MPLWPRLEYKLLMQVELLLYILPHIFAVHVDSAGGCTASISK